MSDAGEQSRYYLLYRGFFSYSHLSRFPISLAFICGSIVPLDVSFVQANSLAPLWQ